MERKQQLAHLLRAYLEGRATRKEIDALLRYFQLTEESDELVRLIAEEFDQPVHESIDPRQVSDINKRISDRLSRHIGSAGRSKGKRRLGFIRFLPYAAAAIIILLITWLEIRDRQQPAIEPKLVNAEEILPGGNKATLSLPDGRTILLDEEQEGVIIKDDHISYVNGAGKAIIRLNAEIAEQLTLATPKGGIYAVTLPDGSRVWLNSSSVLKYPSRFTGGQRLVEIEGEAYFDVTPDAEHPFVVRSGGQEVGVLGTEFNISAYPDEPKSRTTLVEGKVQIVNRLSMAVRDLVPGEQATVDGKQTHIQKVDVTQYTAWKDGFFYFDGVAPQIAFDQMERWYDIEVVYGGKIPSTRFFGMIDRNGTLHDALIVLKESGLECKLIQSEGINQLIVAGE
ncbi:FecR family protein [Parapedobacter sp. DT-150]|uniref:FecR family protein n=1 Tax=Parapedobacter sp. DT-150 TaxID=3396162 RepID=UPI003F1B0026